MKLQIHVTGGGILSSSEPKVLPEALSTLPALLYGRPDVAKEVDGLFPFEKGAVGVYTCGPAQIMDAAYAGVLARGGETYFHSEVFSLGN